MKTKILILLLATFIFNACNKDKFQNKPVLKFKSISTNNVPSGGEITFSIEVSDKQGDIITDADTVFYWKKVSFVDAINNIPDTAVNIPSDLPGVKKFDATFDLTLDNSNKPGSVSISPQTPNKNDSCVFKFWMKDLANHVSDTITSPTIIIQHS